MPIVDNHDNVSPITNLYDEICRRESNTFTDNVNLFNDMAKIWSITVNLILTFLNGLRVTIEFENFVRICYKKFIGKFLMTDFKSKPIICHVFE